MKQIVLTIASKDYTISLEDDFADAFSKDIEKLLQNKYQFGVKDLLTAFVHKCHESYTQGSQMDRILGSLDKTLK
ncbi:hypothetical protein [Campylobacter hyointestinalis]|uniref:Uncharacterized protein n=1 Tax=Campylobacter hyointestinalis TaxID=198 RepID=A0A562XJJ0_CAMHY|nr:hypothetical protein [Campylobacter hyointestinalis]ANE34284.1 hypothetical protein CHL_0935 [Campylobacter hyointestinalis subsp. lawsonii CCUG 27631]RAZ26635.1 hypothetical protein CHL9752_00575 [Campylobacter hyointestinalis subsp. lawsonii]RAZ38762.1 hypothetical protein CHL9426_05150 [Campylobacter hyointestinalis subsp. lawsonii]RAZ48874.1 hypothetical protein CHL14416_01140 [Campylobacter hyointestinalis subsp. lawsonii]RAZ52453.1 hypothetical protein CHL10075_02835 [Campylobacter hy